MRQSCRYIDNTPNLKPFAHDRCSQVPNYALAPFHSFETGASLLLVLWESRKHLGRRKNSRRLAPRLAVLLSAARSRLTPLSHATRLTSHVSRLTRNVSGGSRKTFWAPEKQSTTHGAAPRCFMKRRALTPHASVSRHTSHVARLAFDVQRLTSCCLSCNSGLL